MPAHCISKLKSLSGAAIAVALMAFGMASPAHGGVTIIAGGGFYTAPTTGVYDITAFGASGGAGGLGAPSGGGAEIGGLVHLTAGQILTISPSFAGLAGNFAGCSPVNGRCYGDGGSGGDGTFVFLGTDFFSPTATTLLAAGGGGGGGGNGAGGGGLGFSGPFADVADCYYTGSGPINYGLPGCGGYAGGAPPFQGFINAGGGAGLLGPGQNGNGLGGYGGLSGVPGLQGGGGSLALVSCCLESFQGAGGGGGGYTGGNGGSVFPPFGSGGDGGGSYLDPSVTQLVGITGEHFGNGYVEITSPGPTPGAGVLGFAFLILSGLWAKTRGFLSR
jgi:hypothetical protein